jgi:hypothetical protein
MRLSDAVTACIDLEAHKTVCRISAFISHRLSKGFSALLEQERSAERERRRLAEEEAQRRCERKLSGADGKNGLASSDSTRYRMRLTTRSGHVISLAN